MRNDKIWDKVLLKMWKLLLRGGLKCYLKLNVVRNLHKVANCGVGFVEFVGLTIGILHICVDWFNKVLIS